MQTFARGDVVRLNSCKDNLMVDKIDPDDIDVLIGRVGEIREVGLEIAGAPREREREEQGVRARGRAHGLTCRVRRRGTATA